MDILLQFQTTDNPGTMQLALLFGDLGEIEAGLFITSYCDQY